MVITDSEMLTRVKQRISTGHVLVKIESTGHLAVVTKEDYRRLKGHAKRQCPCTLNVGDNLIGYVEG